MKVFMTGGTGFVGTFLADVLSGQGHQVTILTPTLEGVEREKEHISYLAGNPTVKDHWQDSVADHDVIINLAGASVFSRWTPEQKEILRSSRIDTTRNLVEPLPDDAKGITLFSTSAVGYYGFHDDQVITEDWDAGEDFLARLAFDWEQEALQAEKKGARVVLTRFGIVLGAGGGALGQMIPLYRFFLGGPLGTGKQWFSWIHMADLAEAYMFLLDQPRISGPVNFCSPNPVTNRELAKAIGRALSRPSFNRTPAFMLRMVLGEFAEVLLKGQRVIPRRLVEGGFQFRYPDIETALSDILGS